MKTPAIVVLSKEERKAVINEIAQSPNSPHKDLTIEALNFIDDLINELQSAKFNVSQLQKLFGFKSEKLKKIFQAG